jgi:hypothetical protein
MIIEDITALEEKFKEEMIRRCPNAHNPIVKIGVELKSSINTPSSKEIENILVNIQSDEYYIQVGVMIDVNRRGDTKQQFNITTWPLNERAVKEETVQLSDIVGFRLTFSSPAYCVRQFESNGKDINISSIVENINRQIEMLQAVEQLQQIVRGIIPTAETT